MFAPEAGNIWFAPRAGRSRPLVKRCMPSWHCIRLRACEAEIRHRKVARHNWRSNLPTGLTLIHGRGKVRHQAEGGRRAQDPHLAMHWGPYERELCEIPVLCRLLAQAIIEL